MSYASLMTSAGQSRIAEAISGGAPVTFAQIAVGDGNGGAIVPSAAMTGLVREVWRGAVQSVTRRVDDPNIVDVTAVIPAGAGPFTIWEAGVFLSDGTLAAVSAQPGRPKTTGSQGAPHEITIVMAVVVGSAAQVAVTFDDSEFATRTFVTDRLGDLRVPFIAVDSRTALAPPANPPIGAIWIVPSAPTEPAWSTHVGKLAIWRGETGGGWRFVDAPRGTLVSIISEGSYWRRNTNTASGGSGWSSFNATSSDRGLVRIATQAEVDARSPVDACVTPGQLFKAVSSIFVDGVNGNDTNSGLTPAAALRTLEKALELRPYEPFLDVRLLSDVTVSKVVDVYQGRVFIYGRNAANTDFQARTIYFAATASNDGQSTAALQLRLGVSMYLVGCSIGLVNSGGKTRRSYFRLANSAQCHIVGTPLNAGGTLTIAINAAANADTWLFSRQIGWADVWVDQHTASAMAGRWFEGVAAGANPNAVTGWRSNIVSG